MKTYRLPAPGPEPRHGPASAEEDRAPEDHVPEDHVREEADLVEEFEAWSARVVAAIAAEVRRCRQQQGLSVQQLSNELADRYGLQLKRSVLANLESGRRTTLSVVELLVLAHALRVPPLLLLLPVGRQEQTEIVPGRTLPTWHAAQWFTAERPLPPRHNAAGEPERDAAEEESWEHGAHPARLYREHAELLNLQSRALAEAGRYEYRAWAAQPEWQRATDQVRRLEADLQETLQNGLRPADADTAELERARQRLAHAELLQNSHRDACQAHRDRARDLGYALAAHRRQIRAAGLLPPPLPRHVADDIDDDTATPFSPGPATDARDDDVTGRPPGVGSKM